MESRATVKNDIPHSWWWWLDRRDSPRQSPWLSSTLSDLEKKTKQMLELIDEDADSFAQRAEMYCKKRPQLIAMIQDFYRTHRSLAEQYEQLKSGGGTCHSRSFNRSIADKDWHQKVRNSITVESSEHHDLLKLGGGTHHSTLFGRSASDKGWWQMARSSTTVESSEPSEFLDSEISEVDDPEQEAEAENKLREVPDKKTESDVLKQMSKEVERFRQENAILKAEIAGKDEEKREVIRQLSLPLDVLKEENADLRKIIKDSKKSGSHFEFKKLTERISLQSLSLVLWPSNDS